MKKLLAIIMAALLAVGVTAWAESADDRPEEPALKAVETAAPAPEAEAAEAVEAAASDEAGEEAAPGDAEPSDSEAGELPAPNEVEALAAEPVALWFEEGFGLSLPADWVSYPVSDEDQASGLRYALGDGTGEHFLFIQLTPTELRDAEALNAAVDAEEAFTKRGELTFNGTAFTTFIDSGANASCCAAIWGEKLLMFMFTPQSDADFMLTAPQIMETFAVH